MKTINSLSLLWGIVLMGMVSPLSAVAQPQPEKYAYGLDYFLPAGYSYHKDIPTPEEVIGFQVGQQHVDYGQVVKYMERLAAVSDRVSLRQTGWSYEHRPMLEVVFTSAENGRRIDQLREEHLKLCDTRLSPSLSVGDMPVVVNLIYSVHGNEPSGVNASLAVAYFLAAAEGAAIEHLLRRAVVVMVPGANPDGINRFASWVNSSRSLTDVSDPASREFTEPWPSSRTNHYWANLNRDWLMVQHPETKATMDTYFRWMPNVVADQHEMGASRSFYFSPGHPLRTHPLTPQRNQDLTAAVSAYCAKELDSIGTSYFSKEGYDDYYYGKAAAYGDIHGSVCLLYEQGSTRGHLRRTLEGERTFAWTVRNQSLASYATIIGSVELKDQLLDYQRNYFTKSAADAKKETVKGYVFDTRGSRAVRFHFLENMAYHHIDVYRLAKDVTLSGKHFLKEDALVIPVDQPYSTMVKAVMENVREFRDSTFYDISTWTFPHAFNLNYAETGSMAGLLGEKVTENTFPEGRIIGGKSQCAYLFENTEFYAQKLLYELERRGLSVHVANKPFSLRVGDVVRKMGYGTMMVRVQNQPMTADALYALTDSIARLTGVDVYAATTSLGDDIDLASSTFLSVKEPKVAMLVGRGSGITGSGEAWHLLDYRFQMRPVLIEGDGLSRKKLQSYNVIIMAGGTPALSKASTEALKAWVSDGGTLIASGATYKWVKEAGLMPIETKHKEKAEKQTGYLPYADRSKNNAGQGIDGAILNCKVDKTHPLAWGLDQDEIAVMKQGTLCFQPAADAYCSPLHYTSSPVLSGFVSVGNRKLLANTPAAFARKHGSGTVVLFSDDMNFRSYFWGTSKIFLNAVFFGTCVK